MNTEIKKGAAFTVENLMGKTKNVVVISLDPFNPFMVQDTETNEQYLAEIILNASGSFELSISVGNEFFNHQFPVGTSFPTLNYLEEQYNLDGSIHRTKRVGRAYPNEILRYLDFDKIRAGFEWRKDNLQELNYTINLDIREESMKMTEKLDDKIVGSTWVIMA